MYKFQQPEDQTQFCLPLNRDTEHLYYNTYLVIDANVLTEPRVWQISKINRSNSKGIAIFTCAQDLANQHALKADYDEDGNVIAWWADWENNQVNPTPAVPYEEPLPPLVVSSRITCSGKPVFKIGGSAKTFTVTYYNEEGQEIPDHISGSWIVYLGEEPVSNTLLEYAEVPESSHKIKVKFLGDDSYIGKVLTIKNISDDAEASFDIEINAL